REVLPPDGPGARAAGDGSRGLAPLRGRGGPGARARVRAARGELTPGHGDAAMRGIRRVFRLPHPGRSGAGREVDEELAFHLERVAAEREAEGWGPAEAAREARARFGDLEGTRRALVRRTWRRREREERTMSLEGWIQDL